MAVLAPTSSCCCVSTGSKGSCGTFRTVAVVGPPNAGKTTLFNRLTGLRQKVGNFPGVTVEHHTGHVKDDAGREIALIDLPGVYSLSPKSEDEKVTVDVLNGQMPGTARPDGVIVVVDSTHLNRHLMLVARVIALGLPTLVVLNMADELHKQGGHVDIRELERQLGTPTVLVSATTGDGMAAITAFLSSSAATPCPLELPVLQDTRCCREWAVRVGASASYRRPATPVWTNRLDAVFLHRIWGPVVFLLTVIGVFQITFAVGQPLSNAFQNLLDRTGALLSNHLGTGLLPSLVLNGAWRGTTSVLVFLPQILLLFLVIGILEDSGYLARAAVIADRTMARVGLNGKCFIPLLSAYGCAVPAIMATRTIESKRDRIATILIAPFMTCSARLPVYTMFIAAFLPSRPLLGVLLGTRAAAMLALYVLGFLMAVITARLLKASVLKSKNAPFILEMPPYRWPTVASLGLRVVQPGQGVCVSRRNRHPGRVPHSLGADQSSHAPRPTAPAAGQPHRPRRALCRTRDCSPGIRLEDRRGTGHFGRRPRDDYCHAGHFVRDRSRIALHGFAGGAPSRNFPGGSHCPACLLCLRHAMRLDHGRRPPRNQQLEVAGPPVYLHDRAGLCLRPARLSPGSVAAPNISSCDQKDIYSPYK